MKNKNKIEDSLEFCSEIKYYENKEENLQFDATNYPVLKDYLQWVDDTEKSIHRDARNYEEILDSVERYSASMEVSQVPNGLYVNENELSPPLTNDKEEKRFQLKDLWQLVVCVIVSFVLVYSFTTYIATYTKVKGESMEDTLKNGDYLIVNRFSYLFSDPKPFDIIVFEYEPNVNYIKRVIATPGQSIQIIDGTIYVNDQVVNEGYGKSEIIDPGLASEKITLGEDEYFVLGDNRNLSTDSRSPLVGVVKREQIIGKATLRVYPFDDMGILN